MCLYVFCFFGPENLINPLLSFQDGDSECCVFVHVFSPMSLLLLLLFHATQARDSKPGHICECFSGQTGNTDFSLLFVKVSPITRLIQNKECLLKVYINPFPMRMRLQFGTSPFLCCDWLPASEGSRSVVHSSPPLWISLV